MGVLWLLSSQPVLPGASLTPDWTQHGVAYAGLAIVTLRATAGGRWQGITRWALLAAWVIAVAYGLIDEWHQSIVPARTADLRDAAADAIGAALALTGVGAWGTIRRSS